MLYINIDRTLKTSLSSQVYTALKDAIITEMIRPNEKLPSSRELAKELHIARNVVIECFEQLIAEGYIYSKKGSGTYVSKGVQLANVRPTAHRKASPSAYGIAPEQNYTRADYTASKASISFRTGIPDLSMIPIKKWAQTYYQTAMSLPPNHMDYQQSFGDPVLREHLANYLNRARGTIVSPDNILITNGAAQSFSLLCKLVSSFEYALVEEPLSYGILHTLHANSITMKSIALDSDGMMTDLLTDFQPDPPKLLFTTPSHQFPTGVILPAKRRIEMIHFARQHNAFIVEDDYDSEFRFDGKPIHSMQSLAPEQVIYVGTFSKTLMPALRIGYMVLPDSLCKQMKEAKYVADIHSPVLEQLTLASLLSSGYFDLHIRKMKKLYHKKQKHLVNALKEAFGDQVTITGAEAGLHLIASFDFVCFDDEIMNRLTKYGVEIAPLRKHYLNPDNCKNNNALIFGYGNTSIEDIDKGVEQIKKALTKANRMMCPR